MRALGVLLHGFGMFLDLEVRGAQFTEQQWRWRRRQRGGAIPGRTWSCVSWRLLEAMPWGDPPWLVAGISPCGLLHSGFDSFGRHHHWWMGYLPILHTVSQSSSQLIIIPGDSFTGHNSKSTDHSSSAHYLLNKYTGYGLIFLLFSTWDRWTFLLVTLYFGVCSFFLSLLAALSFMISCLRDRFHVLLNVCRHWNKGQFQFSLWDSSEADCSLYMLSHPYFTNTTC